MMASGFLLARRPHGVALQTFVRHGAPLHDVHISDDQQTLVALKGYLIGTAPATDDARAVATLYREAGYQALQRLEGTCSYALFDKVTAELILSRDVWGGYPLFWAREHDTLYVSNGLRPLYDRLASCQVNREFYADFISQAACGVTEFPASHTCWRGIQRVAPGSVVRFGPQAVTPWETPTAFWDLQPAATSGSVADMAQQCRQLLVEAVAKRSAGVVGAHFSGGMDSTGIALLTAQMHQPTPIHGFARVFPELPRLGREIPFIDEAAATAGNLRLHKLSGPAFYDFAGLDDRPCYDEPCPIFGVWQGEDRVMEAARQVGVQTLLTGLGGDHMFDVDPEHLLLDYLEAGHLRSAYRFARDLSYARLSNCWHMVGGAVALGLRSHRWYRLAQMVGGDQGAKRTTFDFEAVPPWIDPDFAREHHLLERLRASQHLSHGVRGRRSHTFGVHLARTKTGDIARWYSAERYGLRLEHPFLDQALVRYCLQIPPRLKVDPWTQKPLLARALADLLPASIRSRQFKGNFCETSMLGPIQHAPTVRRLLRRLDPSHLPFDPVQMQHTFEAIAQGQCTDGRALDRLYLCMALSAWCDQLSAWKAEAYRLVPLPPYAPHQSPEGERMVTPR